MKIVVKLGGAALQSAAETRACVEAVGTLAAEGHRVAVVHGGGSALTLLLARLGKQSDFVDGLRVTDAETRDAALMVLAGLTNRNLTAAFVTAGVNAVGISGADGGSFLAVRKSSGPDLGFVGQIASTSTTLLDALWSIEAVPVLCSMALGADGEFYNVNADEMAAACAIACGADALFFLTDVDGVRNGAGNIVSALHTSDIRGMASARVITGGMLPKLAACTAALDGGVGAVRILPARSAALLTAAVTGDIAAGTEVLTA